MELYRTNHGYRIWDVPNRLHVGRKEMFLFNDALNTFYLRLYGRKEGNVLFNDALNTFYLRVYGVGHLVKDLSDSERGYPLPLHELLFPISSNGSFLCTIPQTGLLRKLPTIKYIICCYIHNYVIK